MASRNSKAKPATVQDLDEKTKQAVPGTEVSAHSDMRDNAREEARRPAADTVSGSDSGRSSHTYVTLASADSAKMMPPPPPPVTKKQKETTTPPASVDNLPPPTATTDAPNAEPTKKSSRASSPSKKHRRTESRSSRKSLLVGDNVMPIARQQPCNCHHCYYRMYAQYPPEHGHYYQGFPSVHPDAYTTMGYQYSHPSPADISPRDEYTMMERKPRTSSRPRPQSFHSAPLGYDPYNMMNPPRPVASHDPGSFHDTVDRRDHPGLTISSDPLGHGLTTVRESPVASQTQARRPPMHHSYTDYPVDRRYSNYMDYQVYSQDDFLPYEHPPSYVVRPVFDRPTAARGGSHSPTRAGRAPYETHEADVHPHRRPGRSQSVRRQTTDPNPPELGRAPSRSRRDRSHTDLPAYRTPQPQPQDQPDRSRTVHPPSHSRRHSQYIDLASRDMRKPSRSPGHRYTASESRSTRPLSHHAPNPDYFTYQPKKDREKNVDPKYAEARKYQEDVSGLQEEDELAKSVHRSYSSSGEKRPSFFGRGPSLRSTHSGRSHRSHHSARQSAANAGSSGASKRSDDVEIQIKVKQGGRIVDRKKIFGPAELMVDFDDQGAVTCRERSHNSSSSRSTPSVFSGFLGLARRASSTEGNKENRRRSFFAGPILEEVRQSRRV